MWLLGPLVSAGSSAKRKRRPSFSRFERCERHQKDVVFLFTCGMVATKACEDITRHLNFQRLYPTEVPETLTLNGEITRSLDPDGRRRLYVSFYNSGSVSLALQKQLRLVADAPKAPCELRHLDTLEQLTLDVL